MTATTFRALLKLQGVDSSSAAAKSEPGWGALKRGRGTVGAQSRGKRPDGCLEPQAHEAVALLLRDIAQSLADRENVDVTRIRIGPVDLGSPDDHRSTT